MLASSAFTLPKEERLCSQTLIESLFSGGRSRSMSDFPLRVVYMVKDRNGVEPMTQMLVSVPKRHFKRAVKRNRVKRQVREAYRHSRQIVLDKLKDNEAYDTVVVMAFIWLDDKLYPSDIVNEKVARLLTRISEKL